MTKRTGGCRAALLLLLLPLAGCEEAPQPPAASLLSELPKELCARAADGLDRSGKTGAFEHDGRGSATIRHDVWITMGPDGQDELTKALAVDAACKAGTVPREQQVFVRSEEGQTLSSRIVEIAPDSGMFLDDE